jgi:hypothetical protein
MQSRAPTVLIKPAPKAVKFVQDDKVELKETKYSKLYKEKVWTLDDYRNFSPGEQLVDLFLESVQARDGVSVIDWGAGTGRGGYKIHKERPDLDVTFVDFADNCLDDNIAKAVETTDNLHFVVEDLTVPSALKSHLGYCCDVLEHIPEEDIDKVLANILYSSTDVFFMIATGDDAFGKHPHIDEELHLTTKDYHWWLERFSEQRCVVHRSLKLDHRVIFYVTGWGSKMLRFSEGKVNTDSDVILDNIKENAKLGLQEMTPHGPDGAADVVLLAGGPTLNDFTEEIRELRDSGCKLVTTNGSYNWAVENGMKPSLQCIVDAREFNKRFTEQTPGMTDDTKYAIASQCDPKIFDGMPLDRTYLWHVTLSDETKPIMSEYYGKAGEDWFPVPGGSTVTMRTLCLLMMLGYRRIHIFGFDSCVWDDRPHHGYEQKENDEIKGLLPMVIGRGTKWEKQFWCQPWQVFQVREFSEMVGRNLMEAQLDIRGDGIIAYMVETAAKIENEKLEKT